MSHHITLELEELHLADQAVGMLLRNVNAVIEQYKFNNRTPTQFDLNDQRLLENLKAKLEARL